MVLTVVDARFSRSFRSSLVAPRNIETTLKIEPAGKIIRSKSRVSYMINVLLPKSIYLFSANRIFTVYTRRNSLKSSRMRYILIHTFLNAPFIHLQPKNLQTRVPAEKRKFPNGRFQSQAALPEVRGAINHISSLAYKRIGSSIETSPIRRSDEPTRRICRLKPRTFAGEFVALGENHWFSVVGRASARGFLR